jgi:hypothetical protein
VKLTYARRSRNDPRPRSPSYRARPAGSLHTANAPRGPSRARFSAGPGLKRRPWLVGTPVRPAGGAVTTPGLPRVAAAVPGVRRCGRLLCGTAMPAPFTRVLHGPSGRRPQLPAAARAGTPPDPRRTRRAAPSRGCAQLRPRCGAAANLGYAARRGAAAGLRPQPRSPNCPPRRPPLPRPRAWPQPAPAPPVVRARGSRARRELAPAARGAGPPGAPENQGRGSRCQQEGSPRGPRGGWWRVRSSAPGFHACFPRQGVAGAPGPTATRKTSEASIRVHHTPTPSST